MSEYIRNQILGIADNFKALAAMAGEIEQVARVCADTLKAGNKIMFCGNGGSAADSQHLAAELVGRYKLNRPAMNALALTGQGGGEMKTVADFCIAVPSDATNNIQEMHIAVGHLVCELVEQEMYGS